MGPDQHAESKASAALLHIAPSSNPRSSYNMRHKDCQAAAAYLESKELADDSELNICFRNHLLNLLVQESQESRQQCQEDGENNTRQNSSDQTAQDLDLEQTNKRPYQSAWNGAIMLMRWPINA